VKYILSLFVLLSCVCYGNPNRQFGYMGYETTNIGDDIQAIAAKRLLPKNSRHIDREFLADFQSRAVVPTIVNGWFMHTGKAVGLHTHHTKKPTKAWPPSSSIDPLILSMHITGSAFADMFSPEGVEYFKAHAPIGARDYYTLKKFQEHGIPSYFSGCLTLTLDNPYKGKRNDIIYAIDISKECVEYIRSKTQSKVVEISHGVPGNIARNHKARLRYAQGLLNKYGRAKCVITSRLHATMPCLALQTPVLFFGSDGGRFHGLAPLAHHCSCADFMNGNYDYDVDNPPENPHHYLKIRDDLIEMVENWVEAKKYE